MADSDRPVEQLSYAEAMAELDEILGELDDADIDVDTLGSRFERAIALLEHLDERLTRTRVRVDELAPRLASLGTGGGSEENREEADDLSKDDEPF